MVIAITLSRVIWFATERTLLPRIYSATQPTTMPLRVMNNDGTLSNGDKLPGWTNAAFSVVAGVTWMITCIGVTVVLARMEVKKGTSLLYKE